MRKKDVQEIAWMPLADSFVVVFQQDVVGVYTTKAKADRVSQEILGSRVVQVELDYPYDKVAGNEKLFVVTFPEVTSPQSTARLASLWLRSRESHFRYDARDRRFEFITWALTAAAAILKAETARQNFVRNNGIS